MRISAQQLLIVGMIVLVHCTGRAVMADELEIGSNVTVTGVLREVAMTNFPQNPWQELCVETEAGEMYILIGRMAGPLYARVGTQATITGEVKPHMAVKGTPTTVLEVREAELK